MEILMFERWIPFSKERRLKDGRLPI